MAGATVMRSILPSRVIVVVPGATTGQAGDVREVVTMADLPTESGGLPVPWEFEGDGARVRAGDTERVAIGSPGIGHERVFQQVGKSVAIGIDFRTWKRAFHGDGDRLIVG